MPAPTINWIDLSSRIAIAILDPFRLRIFLGEPVEQSRRLAWNETNSAPACEQQLDLPEYVTVIDADHGKTNFTHGLILGTIARPNLGGRSW